MIHAKVDVDLRDHIKAHKAGPAMATWTWGLLYARGQETDGIIPREALRGAWVGEKEALSHAKKLVLIGLWEEADEGWRICKYAEKNETKAAINARRKEVADRVAKHRAVTRYSSVTNANVTEASGTTVPDSDSDSEILRSDLEIASGLVLDRGAPLAVDAQQVFDALDMNRPVGQPVAIVWVAFCGHYAGQHFPSRENLLGKWQKWVNQQATYAAKDRERDRVREDQAAERKRFAREGPERPPPPTQAQSMAFAEQLAARVRASRAARGDS